MSEVIPFYGAAAALGRSVSDASRLLALTSTLADDDQAIAIIGQPAWHGEGSTDRDRALAELVSRWDQDDLGGVTVADNFAALVSLLVGVNHDETASVADAIAVISWLADVDLGAQPILVSADGGRRIRLDPTLLGLGRGHGIDLTVVLAANARLLPLAGSFSRRRTTLDVEIPTPTATPGYYPVLIVRSATTQALPLEAEEIDGYALALSLDVYGLPDATASQAPDLLHVHRRLAARNRALLGALGNLSLASQDDDRPAPLGAA